MSQDGAAQPPLGGKQTLSEQAAGFSRAAGPWVALFFGAAVLKGMVVPFLCRLLEMFLLQAQVPELPALLHSSCPLWSRRQGMLQVTSRWSCFPA